jgi:hypothetical protein
MALYITYENKEEREWHVGQVSPDGWRRVSHIQADGHELEHIVDRYQCGGQRGNAQTHCYSIPMPMNRRVVRWCGDIAKIIVANL